MPERGSYTDKAKEVVKRGGIYAGIAGGALFLVSGSGLALAVSLGGGAAYYGAKRLEGKK